MCYILSMTSDAWGGDSTLCTLHGAQQGGHKWGDIPLYLGSGAACREKKIGPYFSVVGPAHGFVHGFAHGFGA